MASLTILSSFIAILLTSCAIPSLCKSQHHKEYPSPPSQIGDANDKYIDSLPKKLIDYLKNCTKHLSRDCGEQVINATLDKGDVDKKCCHDLVGMGPMCHKSLIKVYIDLPEINDKIDSKVVKSNVNKVFKTCVILDKKKKKEEEDYYTPSPRSEFKI
ncbi:unnamed protein product [Withania somnifera]